MASAALRWALTGVFVACAGLYLARVLAAGGRLAQVAWSLHVLMAVAMLAMAWPWGVYVSPLAYVLLFTAGALYFAYLALFAADIGHTVYHGVMMASMVVMALVMSSTSLPAAPAVGAMRAMPGMDMAGGSGPGAPPSTPIWVIVTCGVAVAFFLGAALRSFFVVIRGPQRPLADLLMAAGMGVSFAALII
ncbi:DUF5134 domain-containing protein [Mycobacterium sp. AT1]|uniref:DUF5134 domain-containing protein n=1 Tax=Mycobacterium sp. AT1 TaxID=1961706 RepID=UPI0009C5BAB8|nr:DUF5134 domain-containing protein [Mycobacterium sp. AT1]OPX13081.1 hypothetical protein B1790_01420 [Mycobacterium sp. AT1]